MASQDKAPPRKPKIKAGTACAGAPAPTKKRGAMAAPSTNKEMREASLLKLEEAAIACFLELGVKSTSVDHVSGRAGMTKGGFYFYFAKKEVLITHIVSRIEADYVLRAMEFASHAGAAKDQLVAFLHQQVAFARDHWQEVALLVLMSLEFRNDTGEVGTRIRAVYDKIRAFVNDVFVRGQRGGEFSRTLPATSLAHFYIAVHDGFLMELVRTGDTIDGPELVRVYRETLLRGVMVGKDDGPAKPTARRRLTPASNGRAPRPGLPT